MFGICDHNIILVIFYLFQDGCIPGPPKWQNNGPISQSREYNFLLWDTGPSYWRFEVYVHMGVSKN